MGKLYKGDVTLWINVPDESDVGADVLIDRLVFATATAASIRGIGVFPENAKNVEPTTIEEWAKVAKAEAALVATDGQDAERFNTLIDAGVTVINARQAAQPHATTV
jgi:hypothetical protein